MGKSCFLNIDNEPENKISAPVANYPSADSSALLMHRKKKNLLSVVNRYLPMESRMSEGVQEC